MRFGLRSGHTLPLVLTAFCCLLSFCACNREHPNGRPASSSEQIVKHIQTRQGQLDATVWRDEILAQEYEKTFTKLADDFRKAENKLDVLATFEFQTIRIPPVKGSPVKYDLDIQAQAFDGAAEGVLLNHAGWQRGLAQFREAGGTLMQVEWQHEKFSPATNSHAPYSEFEFELHGEQTTQSNRFILKGVMAIEWSASPPVDGLHKPSNITITKLSLLERSGRPGFTDQLLVAPDPRFEGAIDMHPLIVADINGDGHDDIILAGVNKVLLNDGRANFQTVALIKEENFYPLRGCGVIADFNGDGKLDFLAVPEMGPFAEMLVLYPGDGSLPFKSPPMAAWEQQRTAFQNYKLEDASVITAADIDHDGDLDLFVAQYKPPYIGGQMPTPYYDANDGRPSYLLLNDGQGHFALGQPQLALQAKKNRRTLAASLVDLDFDGNVDLLTVNDFSGVDLFYGDGSGHFRDETWRLDNRHLFGMAHCFADFDADGLLDFMAIGMSIPTVRRLEFTKAGKNMFPERTAERTDMAYGNRLYLSRSSKWMEPAFGEQLSRSGWSWGATAFDLNNDGKVDVYIANGHVSGESASDYDSRYWTHDIYLGSSNEDPILKRYLDGPLKGLNAGKTSWNGYQHNALFMDVGTSQYINVAFLMGVAHEADCRAVVSADLNEDGKPDLLLTEAKWIGSPNLMHHHLFVHLNQLETGNHWIGVRLDSTTRGVSPIGAKIWAKAAGRTFVAEIVTGDSFQSQHPNVVHFGLGKSARVDDLKVLWPNGKATILTKPVIDAYHSVSP